jgi:tetratricopeptide (TPR) repeat protein
MMHAPFFRHGLPGLLLATCVVVSFAGWAGAEEQPVRHWIDQHEVVRLSSMVPASLELLEQGEAYAMAGDTQRAYDAFHEAGAQARESSLIARRECQALTILGKRAEAIAACIRAIKGEASAMDMRAMVAALMSGSEPPLTGELAQAMRLARRARESMPQEPWGYAAECDIAERIADAQMLDRCIENLERVAPGHYETVRAVALARGHGLTWRVGAGWAVIILWALGTLAHAAWRALRAPGARRRVAVSAVVLVAIAASTSFSRPAHAEAMVEDPASKHKGMLSDWPVDDKDPESSVPNDERKNRNPLQFGYWLMDLTFKASEASKKGDHAAAIAYYKALVKAVPDRSVSFTRLCESYEASGDWTDALETCATALTRPGVTISDYQHYFALALAKKGSLTSPEVETLDSVVQHLREDPAGKTAGDDLECQLGVRLEDATRLERCTAALAASAPDSPRTISYEWALALKRGNAKEAAALLERARSTAMKPEGIEQMERGIASFEASRRRKLYAWILGGAAAAGGALWGLLVLVRRRRTAAVSTPA